MWRLSRVGTLFEALQLYNVFSLKPFGALGDGELNRLSFSQRFETRVLNGGVMHENIRAGSALNKSIPLRIIEPLDFTLFLIHIRCDNLFLLNFLGPVPATTRRTQKNHKIKDFVASSVVPGHKN
jgi:hypothetical protein